MTLRQALPMSLLIGLVTIEPANANVHPPAADHGTDLEISFTGAWETHYMSEGRDSLDGDDLLSSSLDLSYGQFYGGMWCGRNPDGDYDELALTAGIEFSLDRFDLYAVYAHKRFFEDSEHDNEIGFGATWDAGLPLGITPAVDVYYSFASGGSLLSSSGWFGYVSLSSEHTVTSWLTLSPSVALGLNAGYLPDGHDGLNNLEFRVDAAIPVSDQVEIGLYVAWNQAISADEMRYAEDLLLNDVLYGGVSATFQF